MLVIRNRWSNFPDDINIFFFFYQREQEWNISKKELLELVKFGILAEEDIDLAVAAKFNPVSLRISLTDCVPFLSLALYGT